MIVLRFLGLRHWLSFNDEVRFAATKFCTACLKLVDFRANLDCSLPIPGEAGIELLDNVKNLWDTRVWTPWHGKSSLANMRRIKRCFSLTFLPLMLYFRTADVYATTYTAATAALQDVQAKVALTVDGDTVNIPPGNVTWSSTLSLTNAINLIGAGTNSTIINNGVGNMIHWQPKLDKALRLSGITVNSSDGNTYIVVINGTATAVRVDHCQFNRGDKVLVFNQDYAGGATATGPIYGVVDHCSFYNCAQTFYVCDHEVGDTSYSPSGNNYGAVQWNRPLRPGTTNMMVYEDNYIEVNSGFSSTVSDTTQIYGQGGGVRCFRYNTFVGAQHYIDMHGDDPDYSVEFYEVYSNLFIFGPNPEQDVFANQRGGMTIYYSNVLSNYPGVQVMKYVKYWPNDIHTVTNSYWWNNVVNGTSDQASEVSVVDVPTCSGCSTATIHQDQQYFLHAPQSGQTFYPYTPLVYPHPLVSGKGLGSIPPSPTGFHVVLNQ